jgi:Trp operon repressor
VRKIIDKSKGENNLFEYKAVNYLGMIPILTKALQEEHAQLLQTEEELNDLKQRLQNVEALLSQNSASSQSAVQKSLNTALIAKLDQNAPNPFNQKTTISCFVPSNTKNAMIAVYSSNGTQVKAFNNLGIGTNHLDINANTLAGGVYTYVLLIDGKQVADRQMIITR